MNGVNQVYYGGNRFYYLQQYEYGAWWQNLTGNSVAVRRGATDVADRKGRYGHH